MTIFAVTLAEKGYMVTVLVEALCYKPEGIRFDFQ
jgi:hypothetical protein